MIAASLDHRARRNPFEFTHTTTAIHGLTFHDSRFEMLRSHNRGAAARLAKPAGAD